MLKVLSVSVILLAAAAPVFAQPQVQGATGTFATGQTVTIAGASFGSKVPAAPVLYDNFDAGTTGAVISGGWYLSASQSGKRPSYSTTRLRTSGKSAFQDFTGGNYNSTLGLTGMEVGRLYVSGWYFSEMSGAASRNFKPFAFRGGAAGDWGDPEGRLDVYPVNGAGSGHMYVADCDGHTLLNNWNLGGTAWVNNQWTRLESWMDHGTPNGNNAVWSITRNCQPWVENRGSFMETATSCNYTNLYLTSYFATDTGTPQPELRMYWDELYVDNTRARVEVGNASTWAACTHREIQIPQAWGATSITVRANAGAFTPGATAYVYVVNADGVANAQGYPITVGGASTNNPPTVGITGPTNGSTWSTTSPTLTLTGTASDDQAVAAVTWAAESGSGNATSTSGSYATWSVASVPLVTGVNTITVTARDGFGLTAADALTVTYDPGPPGEPGQPHR